MSIAYQPMPAGIDPSQTEELIEAYLPARLDALCRLVWPSIRLWPKPALQDATASRFGGMPAVPPDWRWPHSGGQPQDFLAQIDCAGLPRLEALGWVPQSGMLSFFGDPDTVTGCGPGAGTIHYFPNLSALSPRAHPLGNAPRIVCGLDAYRSCDLPHPNSDYLTELGLTAAECDAYRTLHARLSRHGDYMPYCHEVSRIGGWPDLIQGDLLCVAGDGRVAYELVLQIGRYHDGRTWEDWSPGGLVYFTCTLADLAERRFSTAVLDMQCT